MRDGNQRNFSLFSLFTSAFTFFFNGEKKKTAEEKRARLPCAACLAHSYTTVFTKFPFLAILFGAVSPSKVPSCVLSRGMSWGEGQGVAWPPIQRPQDTGEAQQRRTSVLDSAPGSRTVGSCFPVDTAETAHPLRACSRGDVGEGAQQG